MNRHSAGPDEATMEVNTTRFPGGIVVKPRGDKELILAWVRFAHFLDLPSRVCFVHFF